MTTRSCPPDRSSHIWAIRFLALLAALACVTLISAAPSGAVEYHTTNVGHGWVAGASHSDGSAFSRIEAGYTSGARECMLYNSGSFLGSQVTTTTTCNAWLRDYGNYTECRSYAKLNYPDAFSIHNHTPDDYCASLRATGNDQIQAVEPVPDAPIKDSPEYTPTGTEVLGATTPDPDGGPDFAVRVYRSKTGATCPEAGRVRDGEFGQQYETGWQPLPPASAGACADLDDQGVGFAVSNHAAQGDIAAYALVYGSVSSSIVSVAVQINGIKQEMPLSAGTFLTPTRDAILAKGAVLFATTSEGRELTYNIPIPTP